MILRPAPPLVALGLGALAALGFAPLGWWPLTLIALALWMRQVRRTGSLRAALTLGWCFGIGHFGGGLNWIATAFHYQDAMPHWLGWIAVALVSLYLALWPTAAAGLAWRWGRDRGASAFILIFAAAWILTEWLRATMFTGFAWNPLGVIWIDTPVAGFARWIGTYGLSGLAILVAGISWPRGGRAWRRAGLIAAGAATLLAINLATAPAFRNDRAIPIRVVQPDINQQEKWGDAFAERNFRRLATLTGRPGASPRLVFWPEAAVPDYLEDEPWARARIAALIGPEDVLLTGGTALEYDRATGHVIAARNSLFALDAAGRVLGRYDKAHLVPFGEYLPARPILSAIGLSRLAPGDLDFWPGPGPATLPLPGFGTMGVQICYEIIFPGQVVDRAHRPDFLFNPSNDAWFGAWGPPQHLAQARLRAIEEAMPIIRATPTGISAVIGSDGRLLGSVPWRRAGRIDALLPPAPAPTLFARAGNLVSFLFAAALIALALVLERRRA